MVNDYINYFRSLAISHKDLKHDPLSDTGDSPSGEKHFTRISIEEVVKGMQSAVFFPCMTLELYENHTSAESAVNVKSQPSGAFMIIDHPGDDSFAAQQASYAKSEQIIYELLQRIYQDHKPGSNACSRPFKSFSFDKLEITPVGPVFQGEFGYRVEFNFELQNQINITNPPAAGTFT